MICLIDILLKCPIHLGLLNVEIHVREFRNRPIVRKLQDKRIGRRMDRKNQE